MLCKLEVGVSRSNIRGFMLKEFKKKCLEPTSKIKELQTHKYNIHITYT